MDTLPTSSITPTLSESSFIEKHKGDDVGGLALRLKAAEDFRPRFVLQQIAGRQALARKMPLWADNPQIVYPAHLPMEQCSSFATASYKRGVVRRLCGCAARGLYADLTGGFGVDFAVMSDGYGRRVYVERDAGLCRVARHNFDVLGLAGVEVVEGDGVEFIRNVGARFDVVYMDPARRDNHGGKVVHVSDCEPDVGLVQDMLVNKADFVVVKLSPMLDISEMLSCLADVVEVHVVAVGGECKELVAVMSRKIHADEPRIFAVNDGVEFSFLRSEELGADAALAGGVGEGMYLYEPHSALMKAGAFNVLAMRHAVGQISRNSHLYVSETPVDGFPGRGFRVVRVGAAKDFKGVGRANVAVRNYPMRADELRKKLRVKDGGDAYIFATTLRDGSKVLIETRKL